MGKTLSMFSWQFHTIFLFITSCTLIYIASNPVFAIAAYPIIYINVLGGIYFFILGIENTEMGILEIIFTLLFTMPSLSVTARRLQDRG